MRSLIVAMLILLPTLALAQSAPDPAFLQKAIGAVITQRNNALDALAGTEAQLKTAQEENEKLKKELADAKQKSSASPADGSGGAQPQVR